MNIKLLVLMTVCFAAPAGAVVISQVSGAQGAGAGAASAAWSVALRAQPALMTSLNLNSGLIGALAPVLAGASLDPSILQGPQAAVQVRAAVEAQARAALSAAAGVAAAPELGPKSSAFRAALNPGLQAVRVAQHVLPEDRYAPLARDAGVLESLPRYIRTQAALNKAKAIAAGLAASRPAGSEPVLAASALPDAAKTAYLLSLVGQTPAPALMPAAALPHPLRDPRLTPELQAALGLGNIAANYAVVRRDGRSVCLFDPASFIPGGFETRSLATVDGREVILREAHVPNLGLLPYNVVGWRPDVRKVTQISADGGRTWTARPGDRTSPNLPPPAAVAPYGVHPFLWPPLPSPLALPASMIPQAR